MTTLFAEISMSLDGYVAGPNPTLDEPLGEGGEGLHEWGFALKEWREPHGREGGETNASSEVMAESLARTGTAIMGRRMFSGGAGPWEDDPKAKGWWGDEPPFHHPVFVLTHHERDPLTLGETTFTFVTGGIESALDQARQATDKDVAIAGGGQAIQQYLRAGLLDELHVNVAPVMLGGGVRLFEDTGRPDLELIGAVDAPGVTHLSYRVLK